MTKVLRLFWGYIKDKLNIPGFSTFQKIILKRNFVKYGVEDALIKEFLAALNDCEFARFAPAMIIRLWIKSIRLH